MKGIFNLLLNLAKRIFTANAETLTEAKNYADAGLADKITISNFKLGTADTAINVTANSNAWGVVTIPSNRKLIAPAGFYWYGSHNTDVMVYAYRQTADDTIQFALRNWSSATATLTFSCQYIYMDK